MQLIISTSTFALLALAIGCNSGDTNTASPQNVAAKPVAAVKASSETPGAAQAADKAPAKPAADKAKTATPAVKAKTPPPAGVKGAIFMLNGGNARLLDPKGKEISSFPSSAKGDYTFYDPLNVRVFSFHGNAIYAIDLNDKSTERFADLPPVTTCKIAKNKLTMLSSWSLGLTAGGKSLCVRLQDGPESSLKVAVGHKIDLSTQKITTQVTSDYENLCTGDANEEFCLPDESLSYAHKDPKKSPLPNGMEIGRYECHVKHGGKTIKVERPKGAKGWCDLSLEGLTPSGRFMGVTTLLSEEGEVKRTFDVIDLKKHKLIKKMRTTITPETRIDWDLDTDALLVDDKLLLPGEATAIVKLNTSAIFIGKK